MANNSINLVSLDFNTIKSNLISYLQNNPQFADFNFSGSNFNVLLDVLAYNTYLNSFYLNMAVSESFLDSAQLMGSVISKAKELNYIPRSYRSSKATLNCMFQQSELQTLIIPSGTRFKGYNSNGSYIFVTTDTHVYYPSGSTFTVANLNIYEGKFIVDAFTINNSIDKQQFVLSNKTIDTDTLKVNVIENGGSTNTVFVSASSLFGLTSTSPAYFLQAIANSSYQLSFGDGTFGRAPLNGATIIANYVSTNGTDADGSGNFSLVDNLGIPNNIGNAITPTIIANISAGGANNESIESIRFNAPRSFATQERAVTVDDYIQLVLANFPYVRSCHAFGGETISGSINYGSVFVSVISQSGYSLIMSEKTDIESFLQQRSTIGITPAVIDPNFLYIDLNVAVKYDPAATILSSSGIQQLTNTTISNFNRTYLESFNTEFKFSQLLQSINEEEPSISSCEMTMVMKRYVEPIINTEQTLLVNFLNGVVPGTVLSSSFIANGQTYIYTDYNPNNNTFIFNQTQTGLTINNTSNLLYLKNISIAGKQTYSIAGTIDYINGVVYTSKITVNDFLNNAGIIFYASSVNENIIVSGNTVLEIDIKSGLIINPIAI